MVKRILVLIVMSSVGFSSPVYKIGTFIVGYDSQKNEVIIKNIQVVINDEGSSEMKIEGEELLAAQIDGSKVTSYASKPKKYFFYSLDLNPKKQLTGEKNLIVKGSDSSSSDLVYRVTYCSEGTTALLTAHAGDGSKKAFCATLK